MAELHCNQHPYPSACVFLVTGGLVKSGHVRLGTLQPFVMVAQDAASAVDGWRGIMGRSKGWEPLSCFSMEQLHLLRAKLEDTVKNPANYSKIPSAALFGIELRMREPWVITLEARPGGAASAQIAMAASMDDVQSWAGKKGVGLASAAPPLGTINSQRSEIYLLSAEQFSI